MLCDVMRTNEMEISPHTKGLENIQSRKLLSVLCGIFIFVYH
jgi:hypothetical protein